jgi:hypothetical protein
MSGDYYADTILTQKITYSENSPNHALGINFVVIP